MVEAGTEIKNKDINMVRDFQAFVGVDNLVDNKPKGVFQQETEREGEEVTELPSAPEQRFEGYQEDDPARLAWKVENAKREMRYLGTYPENSKIEHDKAGWEEADKLLELAKRAREDQKRERSMRQQQQQLQLQQQQEQVSQQEGKEEEEEKEEEEQEEWEGEESATETIESYMERTREFAEARARRIGESIGLVEPKEQKEEQKETKGKHGEGKESLVKQTVGAVKEFITGFVETVTHGGTDMEDEE